eukprot:15482841-Alexandrium_andersonii.AAC.1
MKGREREYIDFVRRVPDMFVAVVRAACKCASDPLWKARVANRRTVIPAMVTPTSGEHAPLCMTQTVLQ